MANLSFHHHSPLFKPTPSPESTHPSSPKTLTVLSMKKPDTDSPFEKTKSGFVDYDKGQHEVSTRLTGLRKSDIPRRYRLRVDGDRFQKDWMISDVVAKVLELKRWEDVEGVLNRWVGRFARKNFPFLIKELTQRGATEHSILVFNWMKNQKNYVARNDIYNMMIRLHARHNRTDEARGLFFEMQEWRCKPDAETYNALINAHGRMGQWQWAMNIFNDMLRAAIPPSRSTYNNLINACGSSGNWREALKVCKRMTENGVGPDLVTHNIVLSAYKTGAQYSKALSYFELMKGTNIRADTTTHNIVIYCLVKLGQYGKAIDLFNSMRVKKAECCPDVVTFTSVVHLYSVSGQIENCKALFNTMVAEGLKPNIVAYNTLLGAYASHGMSKEALSVFKEMNKNGLRRDVVSYTSLLNAYGRSQQPGKAKEVFDMIKKNNLKPNIVSYSALIDAYGSNGLLAEAVEVFREMEKDGIRPNVVSICTLLAAMEMFHKTCFEDYKTVDPNKYTFSLNGRKAVTLEEKRKLGGGYNTFMQTSLPEEYRCYNPANETVDSSHVAFTTAFPRGFALEVLKVYSGPPVIVYKFRHWGYMEGPFKGHAPTGELVQLFGIAVFQLDEQMKIVKVEFFLDRGELLGGLVKGDNMNSYSQEEALSCPVLGRTG